MGSTNSRDWEDVAQRLSWWAAITAPKTILRSWGFWRNKYNGTETLFLPDNIYLFHLWEATSIHIHPYPSISIHGSCWTLATSWHVFRWHHWHLLAASVAFCCLLYIFFTPKNQL